MSANGPLWYYIASMTFRAPSTPSLFDGLLVCSPRLAVTLVSYCRAGGSRGETHVKVVPGTSIASRLTRPSYAGIVST